MKARLLSHAANSVLMVGWPSYDHLAARNTTKNIPGTCPVFLLSELTAATVRGGGGMVGPLLSVRCCLLGLSSGHVHPEVHTSSMRQLLSLYPLAEHLEALTPKCKVDCLTWQHFPMG